MATEWYDEQLALLADANALRDAELENRAAALRRIEQLERDADLAAKLQSEEDDAALAAAYHRSWTEWLAEAEAA
jgi:hypothetical protein